MPKREDIKSILIVGSGPIVMDKHVNLIILELRLAKLLKMKDIK